MHEKSRSCQVAVAVAFLEDGGTPAQLVSIGVPATVIKEAQDVLILQEVYDAAV